MKVIWLVKRRMKYAMNEFRHSPEQVAYCRDKLGDLIKASIERELYLFVYERCTGIRLNLRYEIEDQELRLMKDSEPEYTLVKELYRCGDGENIPDYLGEYRFPELDEEGCLPRLYEMKKYNFSGLEFSDRYNFWLCIYRTNCIPVSVTVPDNSSDEYIREKIMEKITLNLDEFAEMSKKGDSREWYRYIKRPVFGTVYEEEYEPDWDSVQMTDEEEERKERERELWLKYHPYDVPDDDYFSYRSDLDGPSYWDDDNVFHDFD